VLEAIGVQAYDEAVYRQVLSRSEVEVEVLAAALERDPVDVNRSVKTLEELGLVHRMPGRPVRLRAARPDVAVDALVNRRREALARTPLAARRLLAELPADERHRPEDIVEVLVGRPAIAARFDQLLDTTHDELMVLDRPPYVSEPGHTDSVPGQMSRNGSMLAPSSLSRSARPS
jgi:sugar-specific transcriptional regulator TrmB